MTDLIDTAWFPRWFTPPSSPPHIVPVTRGQDRVDLAFPTLGPVDLERACAGLRDAQRYLAGRPVRAIAETLDAAAAIWLDAMRPERIAAIHAISVVTGFSPAMVGHAIDLEQRSSRLPDLLGVLDRELGDHRALDGFVPVRGRESLRTTAVGPALVGGIFSANIPALPHLTVLRAFLVKSACLGRVSRGEPIFLAAYARTLAALDPDLADCLFVTWWPPDDHATEAAFLNGVDHLIAYGGDVALAAIEGRAPPGLPATWHGHRLGFAFIGKAALEPGPALDALVRGLAYDVTVFDQHACLAPQALYIETGGTVSPEALAVALSAALLDAARTLPVRHASASDLAQRRSVYETYRLRAALGEPIRDISPEWVASPQPPPWVALLSAEALRPTPGDRTAWVVPVDGLDDAIARLPPSGVLQCAAVAGLSDDDRLRLARRGVTRLCPPGLMGLPSMWWAHDGQPCVSRLVRLCDEETSAPG
ncbi:MAG: hypothetical protein IV100_15785 [Myxococcales bacterium]|nr:hypothetical protein [Myxococcales bacterium]